MTDDELLAGFRAIFIEDTNPVNARLAIMNAAMIEAVLDLQQGEEPVDVLRHYRASIKAHLLALGDIEDVTWAKWCEVPKAEFIMKFGGIFLAFFTNQDD